MTTWAHEQMFREYEEREQEYRRRNPDTGLYSEYNGKDVEVVLSDGNIITGRFNKTYNKNEYRVTAIFIQTIKLKASDIKSIRLFNRDWGRLIWNLNGQLSELRIVFGICIRSNMLLTIFGVMGVNICIIILVRYLILLKMTIVVSEVDWYEKTYKRLFRNKR